MPDKAIKQDINKLVQRPRITRKPGQPQRPGDVQPATVGFATTLGKVTQGIASPLTETSRTEVDFEVFDDFNVWSVVIKVATEIVMKDSNGRTVTFKYADPNVV